jgi:uncharacterized membrane protein YecN with MAPEG domain
MTSLQTVLATAGILSLLYVVLAAMVVRQRFRNRVSLGEGNGTPEQEPLRVAVRCHANFAEYAPFSLILLAGIAWAGAPHLLVTILCAGLLVARFAHPVGMRLPMPSLLRAGGIIINMLVLITAAVTALALAL